MDWIINSMVVTPSDGNYTDVVVTVNWACSGTQTTNNVTYNALVANSTVVPAPSGSFTPYSQLTQDQVLGWIWANGVDQAATEAAVQQQIDNQINPPVVTPPLPWATQAA